MSGYLGRGWLVQVYLTEMQEMARLLSERVVNKVALPYALGDIR